MNSTHTLRTSPLPPNPNAIPNLLLQVTFFIPLKIHLTHQSSAILLLASDMKYLLIINLLSQRGRDLSGQEMSLWNLACKIFAVGWSMRLSFPPRPLLYAFIYWLTLWLMKDPISGKKCIKDLACHIVQIRASMIQPATKWRFVLEPNCAAPTRATQLVTNIT